MNERQERALFSILIPVYNVAPYLRECLDSVFSQSFANWEVICVDDGSSDGSGAILDEYEHRSNGAKTKIKIIHQANGGVAKARNVALEHAQGEWVLFLDADDVWAENLLERVVSVIDRFDCDIVKFGLMRFANRNDVDWGCQTNDLADLEDVGEILSAQALGGWFCQRAYRRRTLMGLFFPQYRIGEDMSFMVQAVLRANVCATVKDRLYGYRCRAGSASQIRKNRQDIGHSISYLKDIFEAFESSKRCIAPAALRLFTNAATELVVNDISRLPVKEREGAFHEAQSSWRRLAELRVIPRGQKVRLCLARAFPFWWVAFILFCVPYRLELKGLHRARCR